VKRILYLVDNFEKALARDASALAARLLIREIRVLSGLGFYDPLKPTIFRFP